MASRTHATLSALPTFEDFLWRQDIGDFLGKSACERVARVSVSEIRHAELYKTAGHNVLLVWIVTTNNVLIR